MKGLFIIIGECFREGGQNSRVNETGFGIMQQYKACCSHKKFFDSLKIDYDVIINTYNVMNQELLVDTYDNYCNKFIFNSELDDLTNFENISSNTLIKNNNIKLVGLSKLFNQCIKEYHTDDYDFVFYFRIDLFLKDKFIETFNVSWNKIMFPSICIKPFHINKLGDNRVNDTMMFIPKKYNMVLKNIEISHNSVSFLKSIYNLNMSMIGYMLSTYYDSDSAKHWNPIYYIAGRPERDINAGFDY
jgi:hypothetical protein